MREEVTPHVLVQQLAIGASRGGLAVHHAAVRAVHIALHIGIGREPARVAIRWLRDIDLHDRTERCQAQQLPGATVVIRAPAAIEDVTEAEGKLISRCAFTRVSISEARAVST